MEGVTIGAALFTGIVTVLVLVILLARSRLIPGGKVTINVNGKRDLHVAPGGKLLGTLTDNSLFIASACGGKGTCGQCRLKVLEGGGTLLPAEKSYISNRQARQGDRLACQVAVLQDMKIQIPDEVFGVKKWRCKVRSNNNVATFIKELVLELPEGETINFQAGGYIQIESPAHHVRYKDFDIDERFRDDWERYGLFELESGAKEPVSRAYSLANYPDENHIIMLNVRIATPPPKSPADTPPGVMSSYLFSLKTGDEVSVSGPFGEFFARDSDAEMVFIGGGAGMAPMRSHIFDQLKRLNSQRKMSFWYGARSLREAFYVQEFDRLAREHDNFSWHIALSEPLPQDNWSGPIGFIHEVLRDRYLANHPAPEECEYYLCGPPLMNASVIHMLEELGVEQDNIMLDDFGS